VGRRTRRISTAARALRIPPSAISKLVGRLETRLGAQLTGQRELALFPETDQDFFFKLVDASLTFIADSKGKVSQVVLHQNGRDLSANRIDEAEAQHLKDAFPFQIKDQEARLAGYDH
jgi:hypothetical protein